MPWAIIKGVERLYERIKKARQDHYEAKCRAQHVRAASLIAEGEDPWPWCDYCGPEITSNGTVHWTSRSLMFYCKYDIPERAGKPKICFEQMRKMHEKIQEHERQRNG